MSNTRETRVFNNRGGKDPSDIYWQEQSSLREIKNEIHCCYSVSGNGFGSADDSTILSGDPKFSTLVSLVTQAGLVDTLNNGTFTIFAPTDTAFNALPADVLNNLQNDVTGLTNVLLYHVLQGNVLSSAAADELVVTTMNGNGARFNIYTHNGIITIQGCVISQPDITASNGVIHVVDSVMIPPSGDLVDFVAGNLQLSTLFNLVQQAGLASALRGDGLTLFAPTEEAFSRLSAAQISSVTSDPAVLEAVLKYHVVPSTEYSVGLYQKESLSTLNPADSLTIHMIHHQADVKVDNGLVTSADHGVTNGVVHLVDHVLIPHNDPVVG